VDGLARLPVDGRDGVVLLRADRRHGVLVDGAQERLLAAEARVDGADRDLGALAHVLDREGVEALLLEQRDRRIEHALERLLAPLLLRGAHRGVGHLEHPSDRCLQKRSLIRIFILTDASGGLYRIKVLILLQLTP
jgi:hypothetical protein